eukprot:7317196-Prymnesium_polylepis.1
MADRLLRRFSSVPTLAFASAKATEEQVRAAFDAMDSDGDGVLSAEEIGGYLDRKGYGEDERQRFFRRTDQNEDGGIDYDEFKRGWTFLSTFAIANHDDGEVMRKPGSVRGLDIVIEDCQNTTIAICDHTAQVSVRAPHSAQLCPTLDSSGARPNCADCTRTRRAGADRLSGRLPRPHRRVHRLGVRARLRQLRDDDRRAPAAHARLPRLHLLPLLRDRAGDRDIDAAAVCAVQRGVPSAGLALHVGQPRACRQPLVCGLRLQRRGARRRRALDGVA